MFLNSDHESGSERQHGSLLRNRVTEAVGITLTFLANVIWVETYNYGSGLNNVIYVLTVPRAWNGPESSF